MAAFYGLKIKNGEINNKTGKPWKITDVPKYFKVKVQAWLKANP